MKAARATGESASPYSVCGRVPAISPYATCVAKKVRSCSYVLSSSSERPDGGGLPAKDAEKRSGGIAPAMLVWMPISSGGAGSAVLGARPPAIRSTTIAPQSPPCATKRSYPSRFISST